MTKPSFAGTSRRLTDPTGSTAPRRALNFSTRPPPSRILARSDRGVQGPRAPADAEAFNYRSEEAQFEAGDRHPRRDFRRHGKAALEGFRDAPGTRIVVFYPKNGVSKVQELQMLTTEVFEHLRSGREG
jgi:hypothetical protein